MIKRFLHGSNTRRANLIIIPSKCSFIICAGKMERKILTSMVCFSMSAGVKGLVTRLDIEIYSITIPLKYKYFRRLWGKRLKLVDATALGLEIKYYYILCMKKSAPIEPWNCNFPCLKEIITDWSTDQQTDRLDHREVDASNIKKKKLLTWRLIRIRRCYQKASVVAGHSSLGECWEPEMDWQGFPKTGFSGQRKLRKSCKLPST